MRQTAAALSDTSVKRIFGKVDLRGCATDDASGIEGVDVTWRAEATGKSGEVCIHPDNPENWVCSWDTTKVEPGVYTVTVTATDNAGNSGSYDRKFLVEAPAPEPEPDTTPPVVSAPEPGDSSEVEPEKNPVVIADPAVESDPQVSDGIDETVAGATSESDSGSEFGSDSGSQSGSGVVETVEIPETETEPSSVAGDQPEGEAADLASIAAFMMDNLPEGASFEVVEVVNSHDGRPALVIRMVETPSPGSGGLPNDQLIAGISDLALSANLDVRVQQQDNGIYISLPDLAALEALKALIPPDRMADSPAIAGAAVQQE